jgi:hypothetical protein
LASIGGAFLKSAEEGALIATLSEVRIPAKTDTDSDRIQTAIPTQNRQQPERSDAGRLIISEVDGFGQTCLGSA